jgi:hypothetical protein
MPGVGDSFHIENKENYGAGKLFVKSFPQAFQKHIIGAAPQEPRFLFF